MAIRDEDNFLDQICFKRKGLNFNYEDVNVLKCKRIFKVFNSCIWSKIFFSFLNIMLRGAAKKSYFKNSTIENGRGGGQRVKAVPLRKKRIKKTFFFRQRCSDCH